MLDDIVNIKPTRDAENVIKNIASREAKKKQTVVQMEQLVTFTLDQEEYAAVITDLREIIRIPDVVAIPGAPGYIRGILNLRGQLVVVVDLERRVGLTREHEVVPKHIIIVEIGETIFGIIVDEVSGVLRVPITTIRPTPGFAASKIHTDFLKGVVILEGVKEQEGNVEEKKNEPAKKANKSKEQEDTDAMPSQIHSDDEVMPKENQKSRMETQPSEDATRLILLLDLPKLLAEKELVDFGKAVVEAAGDASIE